jgi:hypothetical protein
MNRVLYQGASSLAPKKAEKQGVLTSEGRLSIGADHYASSSMIGSAIRSLTTARVPAAQSHQVRPISARH